MSIKIVMERLPNKIGSKSCYCWDGDVLLIAKAGGWQKIIYGFYKDNEREFWGVGIKRNGMSDGRSSHYYQVVVPPLYIVLLEKIKEELTGEIQNESFSKMMENLHSDADSSKRDGIPNSIEDILKDLPVHDPNKE